MAKCRRRRKMCKTRCRTRSGRFKRCRSGDRHYSVRQACCKARRSSCRRKRRSSCSRKRRRRSCGKRKSRYMYRCRSKSSGRFKRCRRCDRKYKLRKPSRRSRSR